MNFPTETGVRLKKNCSGCRALDLQKCTLGYETETYGFMGAWVKPKEICEKPRTNKRYIKLLGDKS